MSLEIEICNQKKHEARLERTGSVARADATSDGPTTMANHGLTIAAANAPVGEQR